MIKRNELLKISKPFKHNDRFYVILRVSLPCGDSFDIRYVGYEKSQIKAFLNDLDAIDLFVQSHINNDGQIRYLPMGDVRRYL